MEAKYKWGIGTISALSVIAFFTRKKWMGGDATDTDATDTDAIGQQYTLLSDYMAIQTKTYKEVSFKKGVVFTKRNDQNGTNINTQPAIKVFVAPSGNDEYVIPAALLGGGRKTIIKQRCKSG